MLHQLFKRPYTLKKHTNAPLLNERLKYLQYWHERGRSLNTLKSLAQYLLRIVDYLNLETNSLITMQEIEQAANKWAQYQCNNPKKKADFSKGGKARFTWYAKHWLRKLNRLVLPPEEKIPLFNRIFERSHALQYHTTAPLLKERLMYLQYWADNGTVKSSLQSMAEYLLVIMNNLNFYALKTVSSDEIEKAANCWARDEKNHHHRKNHYSKLAKARFIRDALHWFEMLGCLEQPIRKQLPFENYLNQYIDYMRHEQGLSENTIKSKFYPLKDFLANVKEKKNTIIELTSLTIEEILVKNYNIDDYSRKSVRSYVSVIRSFLRYAENKGWCQKNLASTIKAPRVYRHESLPSSPSWSDVKKVLENSDSDQPTDIRDRAILMLLSIYGMRCSEVTNLRLNDIDWKNELLNFQGAKRSKPQTFPLSKVVAEAILRYLKEVRPNNCLLREVFLCRQAPYRRLRPEAIYQIVNRRLKPFNLNIQHHGPHALRHACATHLINEGLSLKEISAHLGHQCLETTQIYAKVNLENLRKVAEFELGDLL